MGVEAVTGEEVEMEAIASYLQEIEALETKIKARNGPKVSWGLGRDFLFDEAY